MICPACGTPTVPGARFCFSCGTALRDTAAVDVETERRVVTVLFGDLTDFTSWAEELDPERVGVVTDRVLSTLTAVVADYGGHVDKLVGDGLMAVWGAPTAHEDDPERAVRAAARMQSAVRRVVEEEGGGGRRLGLRVGLNTGEVLAGVQAHLAYTVVGDTVNTASRLSDAARPGSVFAGRDTAIATMAVASWRALPPLRLKGKREPVEAFELVGLRASGAGRPGLGDEAPFVGRDAELGLLIGRVVDVAERAVPRTVLVTGEAGVGKTRLAQELGRFAGELPGARVLWGRSAPYGEGRDLAAVAEVVRTACGIGDADDADTARRQVARTAARLEHPAYRGPVPPALAERLQELLGLVEDAAPGLREGATPGLPSSGDQVRQAVSALLTALASEGPLLLVLDDLHWATESARDALLGVLSGVRGRVLVVGLGRHEVVGGSPWWQGLPEVELLPLMPLEEPAAERLLRAYLGDTDLEPRVRDALLSRAQGNPFFLAELLHLLVDRGVLRRAEQGWVLEGDLTDDVPAGVQAVLAARIDGLDGAAKGVLRDASVVGLRVTVPALEAVGRASGHGQPEVVAAAVAELTERQLLEPDGDEQGVLRFSHTLVRDVAYAGLAKAERARRHAAAAVQAVEAGARGLEADLAAAAQGEQAVRLATEMGLPRDDAAWQARGVAFASLARVGQAALGRDDAETAEAVLARALALASEELGEPFPDDLLLPVHLAHAEALVARHRLVEAEEELAPVLDAPEEGLRAGALVVLGEARRKRGDLAGARNAFVSSLAAASAAGISRVTGEALRRLGLLDYVDGRLRDAEQRFREAHGLAVDVGDARGAGWALQHLAWSATTRGDYALAEQVLDEAAELFAGLEDTGGLSWVAGTEGLVRLLQGRFAEARDLAGSVLPLGEAVQERWGVAALLTIDALAAAELGDVETASAEAARAVERFAEVGDAWGQSLALVAQGTAARGAGDPDLAVDLLGRAVEVAERGHHPVTASLAHVVAGYAHLDRADLDRAEGSAWQASALLASLDLEPAAALGAKVLLAQVLRARGRLEEALSELDGALAVPGDGALLFPRRQALAHRAGTLLQLGRVDEALATARSAVEVRAEDVRSGVLAERALAAALRATGDATGAEEALQRALALATATGSRSEVAATERLLADLG